MREIFGLGLSCLILLSGCASIANGSQQSVRFNSEPKGAKIKIYDADHPDRLLFVETTPVSLKLNRGAGYFKPASYKVVIELADKVTKELVIQASVDIGWYVVGNLFSGELLGWLVIDPITGGMWNLPAEVAVDFSAKKVGKTEEDLKVGLASSVPKEVLAKAVRLE